MQLQRLKFLEWRQTALSPKNILLPTAAHVNKADAYRVTKGLKVQYRILFNILVVS